MNGKCGLATITEQFEEGSAPVPIGPKQPDSEGSALENLAKNLEKTGKYREMQSDVKVNDMIAFKVMTPDFQVSDYAIGLVEDLEGDTSASFDLTLLIMGKTLLF